MVYKSLRSCVLDLEHNGHLVRIPEEVDPNLEMAEIHRRVHQAGGPAVFYERVKGSPFPAVSNLFGTLERSRFIFRDSLERVKRMVRFRADPASLLKSPTHWFEMFFAGMTALPRKVFSGAVLAHTTSIDQLPQIKCWPEDGGAFILLPQVYTEDLDRPGILHSNLGMYRNQISGNEYERNREIGMHYQIRRDIGIHHTKALLAKQPLRVSIFVGGPPAHTFAAVMYLPEGLSEIVFAGALAGRSFRYLVKDGFTIAADADFCITGFVDPGKTKPEGPFGDHLGYYSLRHQFPFLRVERVYHRKDAIWPFTVVGRPPQEDTSFGKLIQEIARPMIPKEIPGVKSVHAVDAAGVHPLLLAIGSERYAPYQERKPRELLTLAHALLGYGPCSLAKYLMIVAGEDNPDLKTDSVEDYFRHLLERVDWTKDLHFETRTTMDTLDYSGTALNEGSKVVMAVAGQKCRELTAKLPAGFKLPEGFQKPLFVMPGILVLEAPPNQSQQSTHQELSALTASLEHVSQMEGIPLMVLADDSEFTSQNLNNFLWVTFTRSDPAYDISGVGSFTHFKHWGCRGPLVIDARIKKHHAPVLIPDPQIVQRVEALAAAGKPLHGIL